jgi:acyl-coenzyme A synthetase/AMP-(fatty) acid ligase
MSILNPKDGQLRASPWAMLLEACRQYPQATVTLDRGLAVAPEAGTRFTLAQLEPIIQRTAARLRERGVQRYSRLVILRESNFDIVVLACAAGLVGCVPVLLNAGNPRDRITALLDQLNDAYLVTGGGQLESLAPDTARSFTERDAVWVVDDAAATEDRPDDAHGDNHLQADVTNVPADTPTMVTTTSGTTGIPKLVLHSARGFGNHIRSQSRRSKLLRMSGTFAIALALTHIRTMSLVVGSLRAGLSVVVLTDPSPQSMLRTLQETPVHYLETYPNVYLRMEGLDLGAGGPLREVRIFFSTFDALHPRSVRAMLNASRRAHPLFIQTYGQSELGLVSVRVYTRSSAYRADGRCVGYPVPGLSQVKLGGEDQENRGHDGGMYRPILAKTRTRCAAYLGQYAQRSKGSKEWWPTGDLGYRSKWGCLHLADREIDNPGFDSLLRLEDSILDLLPELSEAIVVPTDGKQTMAVVATHEDAPLSTQRWEIVTARLPISSYKQISWDDFPRTPTWKVKRIPLRESLGLNSPGALGE